MPATDDLGRETGPDGARALDEALRMLADPVRRAVLVALLDERRVSVDALAEGVGRDRSDPGVLVYHVHLPKLRDAGLVSDADGTTVGRGERFEEVRSLVETVARYDGGLEPRAGYDGRLEPADRDVQ